MEIKVGILKKDQVEESNVMKKEGFQSSITDMAIFLGGSVNHRTYVCNGKQNTGYWFVSTVEENKKDEIYGQVDPTKVYAVSDQGEFFTTPCSNTEIGYRLFIEWSDKKSNDSIKKISFGEFPQTAVSDNLSTNLEKQLAQGNINLTGEKFTFNSHDELKEGKDFQPRVFREYSYNGESYIRFISDSASSGEKLNDGRQIKLGKPYWIKVEPIIWLLDEKKGIAISEKILFAGIKYANEYMPRKDVKVFLKTNIYDYIKNCFEKEFFRGNTFMLASENSYESFEDGSFKHCMGAFEIDFKEASEEEIIVGAIESGIPVFLHGQSSEGKSSRVYQLDPDCKPICMGNETPDSFNGKSVYNSETGELKDLPPTWYINLKERCNAKPNEIHILFLEEFTNALPSIQQMASNLILFGELNGKWKLPPNARIIAAGNEKKDSMVAYQIPEIIFNRFAHVYIHTTVDAWLEWASVPKSAYKRLNYTEQVEDGIIHPYIFAYVAYNNYIGIDVLRTQYTGVKPNADPRKWEMASKMLYKTKQPEMLRALIGEELTQNFIAFMQQKVIGVEEVINGNYSFTDLDLIQKYATAAELSTVDESNFQVVREFMKNLGQGPLYVFQSMWAHKDEERFKRILEIQSKESLTFGKM